MQNFDPKFFQIEQLEEPLAADCSTVSIVIPTFNCSQAIGPTIESIIKQNYPNLEILVIDAGSTDLTLAIVQGYQDKRIHIHSVSCEQRYEMLNRGISFASGHYINFLFPGDFYIYNQTLNWMMTLAKREENPHLVYCGSLIRDGKTDVKTMNRPLTAELLKKGQQPTSLQSCWFRMDAFHDIGKFDPSLRLRGGYDWLCRFWLYRKLRFVYTNRILTDYDLRFVTRNMIIRHFIETLGRIYKYFGLVSVLRWFFIQKDISRFFQLWVKRIKVAFWGN